MKLKRFIKHLFYYDMPKYQFLLGESPNEINVVKSINPIQDEIIGTATDIKRAEAIALADYIFKEAKPNMQPPISQTEMVEVILTLQKKKEELNEDIEKSFYSIIGEDEKILYPWIESLIEFLDSTSEKISSFMISEGLPMQMFKNFKFEKKRSEIEYLTFILRYILNRKTFNEIEVIN